MRFQYDSRSLRVGNVGSLSWFATVYVETHVGFAAAYGLTLGFMAIACIMLVAGKQYYSATVPSTYPLVPLADHPQSRLLTSRTASLGQSGSSSARVEMASRWRARSPPTSLSTVTRLFLGAGSLSTN